MTHTEYLLRELRSSLWLKPTITGLAAIAWVSIAYAGAEYLPAQLKINIERGILINLLGILASTMLTVATFSAAAMVSAFAAVSTTATPRATRIVMEDRSTQNSLTSFLSAFISAIVALVAISLGNYYGAGGRLLLFAGYCFMVTWVLISFVRWVDRVSKLGRMGDTLERVEEACREAFSSPKTMGTLGAIPASGDSVSGAEVQANIIGYVQNIDISALDKIAKEIGATIRVMERPGAFIDQFLSGSEIYRLALDLDNGLGGNQEIRRSSVSPRRSRALQQYFPARLPFWPAQFLADHHGPPSAAGHG